MLIFFFKFRCDLIDVASCGLIAAVVCDKFLLTLEGLECCKSGFLCYILEITELGCECSITAITELMQVMVNTPE